jgi:hypothetical protein
MGATQHPLTRRRSHKGGRAPLTLKRERARFDAERARRQYDAVEPENRLVARSLERVWEERLRRADQVEQEYDAWRRNQSVSISDSDRREILALGEDLPRLWHAATTRAADRKQIVRLVIKDVTLDQKRRRGFVWIKVIWQTGAVGEHWLQRGVQGYAQHADQDRLRQRITELNGLQKMDGEIANFLLSASTISRLASRPPWWEVTLPVIGSPTSAPSAPLRAVRDRLESLSGLRRNQCPPSVGITVRHRSEFAPSRQRPRPQQSPRRLQNHSIRPRRLGRRLLAHTRPATPPETPAPPQPSLKPWPTARGTWSSAARLGRTSASTSELPSGRQLHTRRFTQRAIETGVEATGCRTVKPSAREQARPQGSSARLPKLARMAKRLPSA